MRRLLLAFALVLTGAAGALAGPFDDIPFEDIPRPGGREDMERLMRMVQEVVVYSYKAPGGYRVHRMPRARLSDLCPGCRTLDGRYFYADWDAVLEKNLPWAIAVCRESTSPGDAAAVSREDTFECRKAKDKDAGEKRKAAVGYTVRRSSWGIHVQTKVRFDLDSSTGPAISRARGREMMAEAKACLPVVRGVWARLGIRFDLSLDSNRSPEPGTPDITALLIDQTIDSSKGRRSNQSKYYFNKGEGLCTLILHETGHNLGLDDEYQDDDCPDRTRLAKEKSPWSFMGDRHHDPDDLALFSRHIRRVLAPLCRRPSV